MVKRVKRGYVSILLVALVAFCVAEPAWGRSARVLEQARASSSSSTNTNGGSGVSEARATSKGGEAIARAGVTSEAVTQAENVVKEVLSKVVASADFCSKLIEDVELQVRAEADGLANVFTEALGEVSVEGEGSACAKGEAEARAKAVVFAEAIAAAIVEGLEGKAQANSTAVANVISVGIASAFAKASVSACTSSGTATARQTSFATAIIAPVAEAYVLAIAGPVCQSEFKANAEARSVATGNSTATEDVIADGVSFTASTGDSQTSAEGDAGADSVQVTDPDEIAALSSERCTGLFTICCSIFKDDDKCSCTSATGSTLINIEPPCDATRAVVGETVIWREGDFSCKCA